LKIDNLKIPTSKQKAQFTRNANKICDLIEVEIPKDEDEDEIPAATELFEKTKKY